MASGNIELKDKLEDVINRLIFKANNLKLQVNKLQKQNSDMQNELSQKDEEIENLKRQLECSRLGLALRGTAAGDAAYTPEEAKKKISRIVREIDECIALLKE